MRFIPDALPVAGDGRGNQLLAELSDYSRVFDYTATDNSPLNLMRAMKLTYSYLCVLLTFALTLPALADSPSGTLILEDAFEREEADPSKEQVGNGWTTNSKSRAKGEKQVDLDGGAMHITRADVADHGVSVVHDLQFSDVTIQMKFKIGKKDSLGINIADMKEKSVHAGHICVAVVKCDKVEISDLKTGRMNQEVRTRRIDGKSTDADKQLLKSKSNYIKNELTANEWHQLRVQIAGNVMSVSIDGKPVVQLESPGIGHSTKSRMRLAVAKSAWVDDVKVWRQ